MTKVAIKNENITSFGGIYHTMIENFCLAPYQRRTRAFPLWAAALGFTSCYASLHLHQYHIRNIQHWHRCISLKYDFYKGTRRMKLLDSNEIRTLRDVCIFEVNGMEVYM